MKTRFFLLTFFLLFVRGCDFYSTSLWFFQENGMAGEMNPLTRFFGVGWNGLILSNALVVGIIIAMYYYYSFRYKPVVSLDAPVRNYKEYASQLYFGRPDRFYQVAFKMPLFSKPALAHTGYVMIRVVILGSILATVHNLCQFYNVSVYDQFREIVRRPYFVIFGIIFASVAYFYRQVLIKEYEACQLQTSPVN